MTVTGFGGTDVYVAKLNGSDGSQAWFRLAAFRASDGYRRRADPGYERQCLRRRNDDGHLTPSGQDFGGTAVTGATTTSSVDVYVAKLNSSGVQQWFKVAGRASTDAVTALTVDTSSNVYVAGTMVGIRPLRARTSAARPSPGPPRRTALMST